MTTRKKRKNPWQLSYAERLAIALMRLHEVRLTKWQAEEEQLQQRGEDVRAAVLHSCLAELEGDLEAARAAAMPTPPPQTRSLVDWVKEKESQAAADQDLG